MKKSFAIFADMSDNLDASKIYAVKHFTSLEAAQKEFKRLFEIQEWAHYNSGNEDVSIPKDYEPDVMVFGKLIFPKVSPEYVAEIWVNDKTIMEE